MLSRLSGSVTGTPKNPPERQSPAAGWKTQFLVLAWVDTVDAEVRAYTERMSTMTEAAIDRPTFEQMLAHLRANGFELRVAKTLLPGKGELPIAWAATAVPAADLRSSLFPLNRTVSIELWPWHHV